ncbi:C39 family peptidase [Methanohalobium sp.]|uniref:C39 family peptidase n=1 Tax=Methanohalobium sp. TaxID=2837493 RepID=UPI0025CD5F8D|nr:C39 family peptidase [Methanohalobium sp.]
MTLEVSILVNLFLRIILKNQFVTSSGLTELDVPLYGQEKDYYCAPASGQMIASYYNKDQTQDYIYGIMDEGDGGGVSYSSQVNYYRATNGCDKPGSDDVDPSFATVVSEIDAGRPMVSGIDTSLGNPHVRVCRGYTTTMYGLRYLSINDPWPVGDGDQYLENWGTTNHVTDIIVKD